MSASNPGAPAPPQANAVRTVAQHWEALYAQVENLSPGAAERLFERARAGRGRWTLDEFKGWFNFHYPSYANASKYFVLYIFYALYLAYEEQLRKDAQSGGGWLGGASWSFTPQMAPADASGSVVDAVFAKAERQQERRAA